MDVVGKLILNKNILKIILNNFDIIFLFYVFKFKNIYLYILLVYIIILNGNLSTVVGAESFQKMAGYL